MKFLKKILIASATLILSFQTQIFAQISSDPNHSFYKDAQIWNRYGLVESLPPIRPYPIRIVKKILQNVIDNGSTSQSEKAQAYMDELSGIPFHPQMEVGGDLKLSNSDMDFVFTAYPEVNGDVSFLNDFVGIGYKFGFSGYTKEARDYINTFLPFGSSITHDTLQDPGKVGPMQLYLDSDDCLSIGNDKYFVQFGLNRLGYGNFISNGLTLSENAYHSGNIVLTVNHNRWNFTQLYSAIGATKSYDSTSLHSNKYLTFHQIEFKFTKKISAAYYENIIFGNRFDFSYLIPAPYMAIQGIGGCNDNLQMGLLFNLNPIDGLLWSTDLFVDDVGFNELIKFNFDTKIRIALQTGLFYSPKDSIFNNFAIQFCAVTPYTYSHWDYTDSVIQSIDKNTVNYQNYTNNGLPIGTTLPPNSVQAKFSFDMTPIKRLDMNFDLSFICHGNSAETLPNDEAINYLLSDPNVYATDGGINQHTIMNYDNRTYYLGSAWNKLNYLNQEHKMYVLQGGLNAAYSLPKFKWGNLSFNLGYSAEYIINKGVDSNMFPGLGSNVTDNGNGTYSYSGQDYTASELIEKFKIDWANRLTNQFNSYLTFGIKWRY